MPGVDEGPVTAEALSAQGRVLADDLRDVWSADKNLLNDKNDIFFACFFGLTIDLLMPFFFSGQYPPGGHLVPCPSTCVEGISPFTVCRFFF